MTVKGPLYLDPSTLSLWPFVLYSALVIALVAFIIGLSAVLGQSQRHRKGAAAQIYESGLVSTGSAHVRFAVKFYLIAMFFVIFDLEAAFIYLYAVTFQDLGWTGYIEINIFIGILLAALVYLWRNGALDWGTIKQLKLRRKQGGPS